MSVSQLSSLLQTWTEKAAVAAGAQTCSKDLRVSLTAAAEWGSLLSMFWEPCSDHRMDGMRGQDLLTFCYYKCLVTLHLDCPAVWVDSRGEDSLKLLAIFNFCYFAKHTILEQHAKYTILEQHVNN
eukprot:2789595-Rhodomonas_salina.2